MRGLIGKPLLRYNKVVEERPPGDPELYDSKTIAQELWRCSQSLVYFIHNYIYIMDLRVGDFVPFHLYPAQANIAEAMLTQKEIIALKARQIGLTTLVGVGYYLWLMLFHPNSFCLILSKSEREAKALLTDRVRKAFWRLPGWMRPREVVTDSTTELVLGNNSILRSLPTSAGDSYTCRAVLIDEAALVYRSKTELNQVLLNVRPTVDAGGQLILVSKADKTRPESTFNNLFHGALKGENGFFPIFASWRAVPWRDEEWYKGETAFSLSIDGTYDYLYESYPATHEQALMQKQLDKRFSYETVHECYDPMDPVLDHDGPDYQGLSIFTLPESGKLYVLCVDTAEGNPGSDDSCADVFDWDTGEQVANLSGKIEPDIFGIWCANLADYYNRATVWPERNNHGHTLISTIRNGDFSIRVAPGPDSPKTGKKKYGYLTTSKNKAIGYDELAKQFKKKGVTIRHPESYSQLQSLDGATLSAPAGMHDDHAITFMLFAVAKKYIHLSFVMDLL